MRTALRIFLLQLTCLALITPALQAANISPATAAAPTAQQDAIKQKLAGMQIPFIENKGQMDKSVAFYAPTFAGTVFVTKKGELVYSLPANNSDEDGKSSSVQVLTERLVAGKPVPAPLTAAATKVSYFLGNDKSKWQSGVSTQSAISLGEVWEGIDVELHAHGKNVEKFFTVRPGASVETIKVQLDGAESLKIARDGALDVATESGVVRFTPPVAWQEKEGKKLPVQVAYAAKGDTYGFTLGKHDASLPVIIDPLLQSTYLGGSGYDDGYAVYPAESPEYFAIAIHPVSGDVYVAGATNSTDFPGTAAGAQTVKSATYDAFVSRLSSDLTVLKQSTYLGGLGFDGAKTLAIHPSTGDVYIGGYTTSTDLPGITGGQQMSGGGDGFVARFSSDLTVLLQSAYLGGSSSDERINALAIHPLTGEVYAAGYTASSDLPGTIGGAQTTYGGNTSDGFITRLSSDLSTVPQATYLGGSGSDKIRGLAIHPVSGDVYVAGFDEPGSSTLHDFPGIADGAQASYGGGDADAFVSRLNANLSSLLQSSYLGGFDEDRAFALAIHPVSGHVYVAGQANSEDFPNTAGGALPRDGTDAFIARMNIELTSVLQSTFLGGAESDDIKSLAIHPVSGDIFVSGYPSYTFPGTRGGAQELYYGWTDGYVSRLNASLTSLVQSTFLGGYDYDLTHAIAIHPTTGEVYAIGFTSSLNFPGTAGGAQPTFGGGYDVFISRFTPSLAKNDYTLTAAKGGTGGGVVTSADGLINCGSDCNEAYGNFRAITLTALPNTGSLFTGWTGACTNVSGDCVVSMTGRKNVTANFANNTVNLSVSKTGTGTGTVTSPDNLINCGADCSENYVTGTVLTLTAKANAGSKFANWSGACSGTALTCSVTMDAAKTATAKFNLTGFTLTLTKLGTGSGTVTSADGLINCGADCTENYTANTVVTLTATPSSGSTFAGWSNGCTGTGACVTTMSAAKTIRATFNAAAVN